MNNVDLGKYKKLVQDFWDPEPKNDEEPLSSIWCLGIEYPPPPPPPEAAHPGGLSCSSDWTLPYPPKNAISDPASINNNDNNNNGTSSRHSNDDDTPDRPALPPGDDTAPQERHAHAHYYHSAQNDGDSEHGWPPSFLDDFEAKMWLTYRSNFPAIPKSDDPNAPSSMTLSVRLRSQLVDSQGFTSDTGWGCMIRSGQSLLANALSILSLGRGMFGPTDISTLFTLLGTRGLILAWKKTGDAVLKPKKKVDCSRYSQIIPRLLSQYIDLLNMVLLPVENIPVNGSDHQRQRCVSSESSIELLSLLFPSHFHFFFFFYDTRKVGLTHTATYLTTERYPRNVSMRG